MYILEFNALGFGVQRFSFGIFFRPTLWALEFNASALEISIEEHL